jgi:CRISPR/Cas system-associated exonuclease Cas4 (RecB family)
MSFVPKPTPTFGHPVKRAKPYIYVTWLAKLLGGDACVWSAWFKAHYQHKKFETNAEQLQEWNRDHTALMATVRRRLEENGWRVFVEDQNEFKLRGQVADVAGKADIIATMPGHVLVADGKTGKPRDSDWWQVVIYLFAVGLARPDLLETNGQRNEIEGEVVYYGKSINVPLAEVSEERREAIVRLIKVVGGPTPPARMPSRRECERCTIGYADCPERWREDQQAATATVGAF